jgi:serine protease Do
MSIGEVGEKLRRSTVQVRSGGGAAGSGVVWDCSGAIVTNAHVVADLSQALTLEFWDGRTLTASLDRRDLRRDLAILRAEPSVSVDAARFGDSGRVRVGELVIAVGNPFGFTGAMSTGLVHGIGPGPSDGQQFIQTTARLAPGNSGGPLADACGAVIGINTMVTSGGLGLAIPSNAIQRLLSSRPPFELGVTLRPVRISRSDRDIGLLVLAITPGSAAEYASLRAGDLLVGCAGRRFASVEQFREVLDSENDRAITVQFLRGGGGRQREVTLSPHRAAAA